MVFDRNPRRLDVYDRQFGVGVPSVRNRFRKNSRGIAVQLDPQMVQHAEIKLQLVGRFCHLRDTVEVNAARTSSLPTKKASRGGTALPIRRPTRAMDTGSRGFTNR